MQFHLIVIHSMSLCALEVSHSWIKQKLREREREREREKERIELDIEKRD